MRIIRQDEDSNQERVLLLVMPYGEEGSDSQSKEGMDWPRNPQVSYHEGQFNMDLNTLMLIARQERMSMAPKRASNMPLGPCYNYLGDHLIQDCPHPRQS